MKMYILRSSNTYPLCPHHTAVHIPNLSAYFNPSEMIALVQFEAKSKEVYVIFEGFCSFRGGTSTMSVKKN